MLNSRRYRRSACNPIDHTLVESSRLQAAHSVAANIHRSEVAEPYIDTVAVAAVDTEVAPGIAEPVEAGLGTAGIAALGIVVEPVLDMAAADIAALESQPRSIWVECLRLIHGQLLLLELLLLPHRLGILTVVVVCHHFWRGLLRRKVGLRRWQLHDRLVLIHARWISLCRIVGIGSIRIAVTWRGLRRHGLRIRRNVARIISRSLCLLSLARIHLLTTCWR